MIHELREVLAKIGEEYKEDILAASELYLEVDIGKEAEKLGYSGPYRHVHAVVPLKLATPGMKVRVDGRTFVNYGQFESGIVVPDYIARLAGLPFKPYTAPESLILNLA